MPLALVLAISSAFSSSSFAADSHALEQVVVTATRSTQKAGDVLADHVVITEEQILQSGQTSIIDLLQTQRSVEVTRNGNAGNSANVFIRGSNEKQVVVLIDGVRTMSSTSGSATWSTIPLSQVERIEIVMGPMSSLYGADAVGGVIQIFTKKGSGSPRLTFSAGAGTYGERVYSAGILGSTEGDHPIRYSFNTSQEESDGFSSRIGSSYDPDKDGYTKTSTSGQISWQLTRGHELGIRILNSRNDGQYDPSTGIPVFKPYIVNDIDIYSAYSRNQFTSNWTSLFQVARSYNKQRDYRSAVAGVTNSSQDQFLWQNDIKIGTDLLQILTERREETVATSSQPAQNRDRSNNSIAVAYQLNRGSHLASASLRYDDSSVYGGNTTGSVGYGYKLTNAWRINGSLGTSFRAPTYNELYFSNFGNPQIKPEEGKNRELGVYYDDGRTDFSAVYYHNRLKNLITNVAQSPCSNPALTTCITSVDNALLEGLSLSAARKFGDFRVFGNFDWQNPKDLNRNTYLARRARQYGTIGVTHMMERFKYGFDVIYSGARYENITNTIRLGGYALLNLHATYDLSGDWQLFARWNNVLDKKYELAQTYQTPGSNVFAGIRYGFK